MLISELVWLVTDRAGGASTQYGVGAKEKLVATENTEHRTHPKRCFITHPKKNKIEINS